MKLNTIERKRFRVRKKLKNVYKDRYRLSVSRSSKNISAQIIDDVKNITLVSASSVEKDIKDIKGFTTKRTSVILAHLILVKIAFGRFLGGKHLKNQNAKGKKLEKPYFFIIFINILF